MLALQLLLVAGVLGGQPEAVLLNFTQANCPPCRAMEPVLAELEAAGLPVQSINVEQHPEVAQRFKLSGTPTYVMLVDGQETGRAVGVNPAEKLRALFPSGGAAGAVRGQSPEPENHLNQRLGGMFGKEAGVGQKTAPSRDGAPPGGDPFTQRQVVPAATSSNVRNAAYEAPADNADPQGRAMAATVRLKVEEPQGHAIGTGTIIDIHGDEAMLITCAHIFRASQGKGRIQVELFHPQLQTVEGKLIEYDLQRDIAVVSIVSGSGTVSAPVAPTGLAVNKQDAAFSVGCDRGADPTIRQTKITSLNRYVGPPNIEAAGEPTIGRSGGGLFSRDGYLIGVCNCADAQDDEGIYAATATIHWLLDKVGLAELFKPQAAVAEAAPARDRLVDHRAGNVQPLSYESPVPRAPESRNQQEGDTEIICIVRSKSNPSAKGQVVVIPRASQLLLQQIAADSADPTTAADLSMGADRRVASAPAREAGPIVRGQSR